MLCITILMAIALFLHINGVLFSACIGVIGGLGGFLTGQRVAKKQCNQIQPAAAAGKDIGPKKGQGGTENG